MCSDYSITSASTRKKTNTDIALCFPYFQRLSVSRIHPNKPLIASILVCTLDDAEYCAPAKVLYKVFCSWGIDNWSMWNLHPFAVPIMLLADGFATLPCALTYLAFQSLYSRAGHENAVVSSLASLWLEQNCGLCHGFGRKLSREFTVAFVEDAGVSNYSTGTENLLKLEAEIKMYAF